MQSSKRFVTISIVAMAGIQLIPAGRTSAQKEHVQYASVWNDATVPPTVKRILRNACADCHSDETRWPWYSRVAPISWLLDRDVTEGRNKLNLSRWVHLGASPGGRTSGNIAEEICDAIDDGSMPLAGYTLLHSEARLSSQEKQIICRWASDLTHTQKSELGML